MNRSIVRLFGVIILLFTLLIVWTSRWTVFQASALQNNPLNKLAFFESLKVKRGQILADNGEVLAQSVSAGDGTWARTYPQGSLFAQPIGYFVAKEGSAAGLERADSSLLNGTPTGITSVFGPLGTGQQVGDDVHTTLDPTGQKLAQQLLAGRTGSVVAIVPQTGAVKVMYSNPTYNDNAPNATCSQPDCKYNLATQGLFPPGSTFKIVTTTAALNTGDYTPNSTIVGNSPLTVSGVPLENDGNQSWGPVSLTKALTYSINTVYAQVGQRVGRSTMEEYMKRFGFYSAPPLDYPVDEMEPSGEWQNGSLLPVTSDQVDLGRTSIGQDYLLVTPLQMAMVASTVADGGKLMKPHMTSQVVSPDGQILQTVGPHLQTQVMSAQSASELTQMMTDVVEEGTGTAANLEGLQAAGKTGTAQVGGPDSDIDDAWFIGFAPINHPRIAVAVVLPDIPNGYGGIYAAPIAAQEMKTLLAEGA